MKIVFSYLILPNVVSSGAIYKGKINLREKEEWGEERREKEKKRYHLLLKLLLGENEKTNSSELRAISFKEPEENVNAKIKTWKDREARSRL